MITPLDMLEFAKECERWAAQSVNASQRALMMQIAKSWRSLAAHLEKHSGALPDLRDKLD
jgi:hypothetical protein